MFYFLLLFIFNSYTKEMPEGMDALALLYFAKIQWHMYDPWIYPMDIHGKSMDMDMDGKFHIHGKPLRLAYVSVPYFNTILIIKH